MARSVADATRFTATGPHAAARPKKASTLNFTEAPPNETPQQKIRRLREAARVAKLGQVSQWDRIIERGRTVADKSHRIFSLTLIGFTAISLVYCGAATFDMISYNRKKRRAFFEQQEQERLKYIELAQQAENNGTATQKQIDLLQAERLRIAEDKAKEDSRITNKVKRALFGGLAKEDTVGGKLATAVDNSAAPESSFGGTSQETGEGIGILHAVQEKSQKEQNINNVTPRINRVGGPLDQWAGNAAQAASQTSKSWTSWITSR